VDNRSGKVLAVDLQPQMVEMLRTLSGQTTTHNVVPVQATARDPSLPVNSVDLAILVDVYHELEFPQEVISHVYASLKTGGDRQDCDIRVDRIKAGKRPFISPGRNLGSGWGFAGCFEHGRAGT
jgi:hypothetical protein